MPVCEKPPNCTFWIEFYKTDSPFKFETDLGVALTLCEYKGEGVDDAHVLTAPKIPASIMAKGEEQMVYIKVSICS